MPDILPTIDNEPAQGIQALLDTVYLWNQDIANDLIEKINELLEELQDLTASGEIKPYSELTAPVRQYLPMYYGDGVYVAAQEIDTLPSQPDMSKWILIATKGSTFVAGSGIDISGDVISVKQAVIQGASAGSTAVQPADLAAVATTGDYDDLLNKPVLGTAAAADTTDFATAAQGTKADTAVQPADMNSAIASHNTSVDAHANVISPIASSVSGIEAKIPSQASSSNQLADKDFVNSSIATNTANFIGTFNSVAELEAYSGPITNNDYAYVIRTDATGNTLYDRYKYTDATTPASWEYEYTLNNSSFTADQWAAINSHATAASISQISTNQQNISGIQTTIGSFGNIVTHDVNEFATASQGAKADTAVQPGDLATVATTGDYEDLTNKPVIPEPGIPQYTTMPTASASNVGKIAQYSGETVPDVPASATIEQTTGSGLTDLQVNVQTFEGVEQPSGSETVSFVCSGRGPNVITGSDAGLTATIINVSSFMSRIAQQEAGGGWVVKRYGILGVYHGNNEFELQVDMYGDEHTSSYNTSVPSDIAAWGIEFVAAQDTPTGTWLHLIEGPQATITDIWTKDSEQVSMSAYGISYAGTPSSSDVLTVSYTPFVAGITNGYFYKCSVEYGNPTATISQTTGSGLTDLVVNVDTFVETEQPVGDEEVEFVCSSQTEALSKTSGTGWNGAVTITDEETFIAKARELATQVGFQYDVDMISLMVDKDENGDIFFEVFFGNSAAHEMDDRPTISTSEPVGTFFEEEYGFVVDGTFDGLGPNQSGWLIYESNILTVSHWSKDNVEVNPADYGVSYSGTPTIGDVLTVDYVAPTPVGYYWSQTNVQPGSCSGGGSQIEWKTTVDLPGEYSGDTWNARPYYTISGGLPDGEYEFYILTKTGIDPNQARPYGAVVFKARFNISMQEGRAYGTLGYVFDGNYSNNVNRAYGNEDVWVYDWIRKNGSDLVIYAGYMFASDILNYNNHETVPECFKMSAIKNVTTGEEYIASGAINIDGSVPTSTEYISGNLVLKQIVNPPYIPEKTSYYSTSVSELENKTFYFSRGSEYCTFTMEHAGSNSVFVVEYTGAYRDQAAIVPYTQKIIKATGIFADCYLATKDSYIYVMGVDTVTAATSSGLMACARGVISNETAAFWIDSIPQGTTPIAQSGPQGARLGTITYDGLGNVVQYTGETNANYTNGYFYKATGTAVTVPASISFINIDPGDVTVAVADPDALVTALNSIGSWGEQWVRDRLTFDYTEFNIGYNFDTGTITRVYWNYYGDIYTQDVFDCFAVSTTGSYTGEITISFACDRGYVPESKGVQNTAWVRVDVQPGGGGGAVSSVNGQTGTVVLGAADVNAVPLAGGTMTGDLTVGTGARINITSEYTSSGYLEAKILNVSGALKFVGDNESETGIVMGLGHNSLDGRFMWQGLYPINTGLFGATLGTINHKWSSVYATSINNGAGIAVPTTGGTMVVAVPPTTPNTTWVLKATVDANGDCAVAWVQEV